MSAEAAKSRALRIAGIGVLLLLVYCMGVGIRWRIVDRLDDFYGGMIYTRESALYFHFARELAEEGSLPEGGISKRAQHPEGFDIEGEHTFAKGKLVAYCYRWFCPGSVSFESFARRFDGVFFCLGVFPFFFLMRLLSRSDWIGLLGSALYVTAIPALQRSTGAGFDMETFSIPLLLAHVCLFAYGIRKDRALLSSLSGLFLAVAVAGWDFCQFYLLIVGSFVFFSIFLLRDWAKLLRHFAALVPCLIMAGLVSTYLRRHYFLASYGMLLAYPLAISAKIIFFKRIKKLYIPVGIVVILGLSIIFTHLFFDYSRVYSHVGQKFYSKIKHLNSKPSDPSKLSFTERIEWTPPFHSATEKFGRTYPLVQMLRYLVPALVPLILFTAGFFRGRREQVEALIFYNVLAFLALYLMFVRVKALLIIFLILALGSAWRYFRAEPS